MRRERHNLFELHFEKALLTAAAALALYATWACLFQSPNRLSYAGRELTPRVLHEVILQEAGALERLMRAADARLPDVPAYHRELRELHACGVFGAGDESGRQPPESKLRLATVFGTPLKFSFPRAGPIALVVPLPPTRPTLLTGRALVPADSGEAHQLERLDADAREVAWIRIAARIESRRQREALRAAGYPDCALSVDLVAVEAQRQVCLAENEFSPWEDVESLVPPSSDPIATPLFDERSGRLLNREALGAAFVKVRSSQERRARPPFGPLVAGERPPAETKAEEHRAGEDGESSDAIWTYDTRVEAGRIYRYRVRLRVWNRFAGCTYAVQNKADAARATIAGRWSQPSEPIRAAPQWHLFVLGPSVDGTAANFEVWRWHLGRWLRKSFAARIGDTIGGVRAVKSGTVDETGRPVRERIDFNTGVVVLDVRRETRRRRVADGERGHFNWVEQPTLVVVCRDPADGRVFERSQLADRGDPLRERLRGAVAQVIAKPTELEPSGPRPRPGPP